MEDLDKELLCSSGLLGVTSKEQVTHTATTASSLARKQMFALGAYVSNNYRLCLQTDRNKHWTTTGTKLHLLSSV
jgi:hypothetical protein